MSDFHSLIVDLDVASSTELLRALVVSEAFDDSGQDLVLHLEISTLVVNHGVDSAVIVPVLLHLGPASNPGYKNRLA